MEDSNLAEYFVVWKIFEERILRELFTKLSLRFVINKDSNLDEYFKD